MAIGWTPELTLNHDDLDPEHVIVFRLLGEAVGAADSLSSELLPKLAAFADALVEHVRHEELIMAQVLYPDRARHKLSHDLLVSDVLSTQSDLKENGPSPHVIETVRKRIPDWLRFHTRENDVPLGEYLARHGPKPTRANDPSRRPETGRRRS